MDPYRMKKPIKHAFLITAYRDVQSLKELINDLLFLDHALIFCQIDARSTQMIDEINAWVENKKDTQTRIHLITQNKIHWGSSDHLIAQINLSKLAFHQGADYFHTITGQCRLICNHEYFTNFFDQHFGKSYIETFPLPTPNWQGKGGLERVKVYQLHDVLDVKKYPTFFRRVNKHFTHLQRLFGINRLKSVLEGKNPYGGSSYWSIHKDAMSILLKDNIILNQNFKNTFCSEEIIPHTILKNDTLIAKTLVNHNLRYIFWEMSNGEVPGILDETHLDLMNEKRKEAIPVLFGRKFDSLISKKLIDQLKKDV